MRRRGASWAIVLVAATAGRLEAAPAGPVEAAPADRAGLAELFRELGVTLDAVIAERVPRPPVPVPVNWRDRRVASMDLGAPLLAVGVADIDRDGRAELVALTSREVVALNVLGKAVVEKARGPLGGEPAALRPRDPIGVLEIERRLEGDVYLHARSSEQAEAVSFAWRRGQMVEVERGSGFPLCRGVAELVPGRNYFAAAAVRTAGDPLLSALPAEFFSVLCRDGMVDARGGPIAVAAVVDVDRVLHVRCRAAAGGECAAATVKGRDYDGVGVVADIADIDNDGVPEVLTTRGGAPGDRDRVSIYSVKAGKVDKVYSKDFHAGVVGLGAGDIDGDGDREVVVAVRFAGSHHVSFWTLN